MINPKTSNIRYPLSNIICWNLLKSEPICCTQMAAEVRKQVNDLDNRTTSKAIDALLNFETVTLFNNQRLEVGSGYFTFIRGLRGAYSPLVQYSASPFLLIRWASTPPSSGAYREPPTRRSSSRRCSTPARPSSWPQGWQRSCLPRCSSEGVCARPIFSGPPET